MSDGGKGDSYRKVDWARYKENYDKIFKKEKVKVSGVPYEVEISDLICELERENQMLRARNERLERELLDLTKDNNGKH